MRNLLIKLIIPLLLLHLGCDTAEDKAKRRRALQNQLFDLIHGAKGEVLFKSDNPNFLADLQDPANHSPTPVTLEGYDRAWDRVVEQDKNKQRYLWHRNPSCSMHVNDLGSAVGFMPYDGKPCPVCMATPQQIRELEERIKSPNGTAQNAVNRETSPVVVAAPITQPSQPPTPAFIPTPEPTPIPGQGPSGTVLERLDAGPWCYLRLKTAKGEAWVMGYPATKIEIGTYVTVVDVNILKNVNSKTLNRTFAEVYMGSLVTAEGGLAGKVPVVPKGQTAAPAGQTLARISGFEATLQANPKDHEAWLALGNEYFDSHQAQKAVDAYAKALALKPGDPNVLTDQGVMFRELGQFDKALANFQKANKLDPNHIQSLFNTGVIYANDLHKPNEAMKALNMVITNAPNSEQAKQARQLLANLK